MPVLAAVGYVALDRFHGGQTALGALEPGKRQALFIAIGTTTGALLGFAIAGMTIVLTVGQGPRIAWLTSKSRFRQEVRFLFVSAIWGLAVATIAFLTLIATDTGQRLGLGWGALAIGSAALALDRLHRLVSFLSMLMKVSLADADDKSD